jgi:hypothetical protein
MEPTPTSGPENRPRPPVAESPFMSIISALLFLYIGFWLRPVGMSDEELYDGSVAVFVWMARIVGIGLLVVAGLTYLRLPFVYALDLILALLATVGCVATGVIWLAYGDGSGWLLLIFGLLNASAARAAWRIWRAGRSGPSERTP